MKKIDKHIEKAIGYIFANIIILLCLSSVAATAITHWNFLAKNSWVVAFLVFIPYVMLGAAGIYHHRVLKGKVPFTKLFFAQAGLGAGYLQMLVVVGMALHGFYDIYQFAASPEISTVSSVILVIFITLAVGVILFYIRLKWRFAYGLSEMLVGIVVAAQRFYSDVIRGGVHSTTPIVLAILTAGVYLVVRGADNMHQGLTKEPLDPIGQRLLELLGILGENVPQERRKPVLQKVAERFYEENKRRDSGPE